MTIYHYKTFIYVSTYILFRRVNFSYQLIEGHESIEFIYSGNNISDLINKDEKNYILS